MEHFGFYISDLKKKNRRETYHVNVRAFTHLFKRLFQAKILITILSTGVQKNPTKY